MADHKANKNAIRELLRNAHPEMKHYTIQLRRKKTDNSPYYVVSATLKNYMYREWTDPVDGRPRSRMVPREGQHTHIAIPTQLLNEIQTRYEALGFNIPLKILTFDSPDWL